jgi:hypothetical protein
LRTLPGLAPASRSPWFCNPPSDTLPPLQLPDYLGVATPSGLVGRRKSEEWLRLFDVVIVGCAKVAATCTFDSPAISTKKGVGGWGGVLGVRQAWDAGLG